MTCITKQHVGKYTYLYESTSFRDELGRSRNKKVKIGKIDLKSGLPVYTKEYLDRMSEAGTPVQVQNPEPSPENTPYDECLPKILESVTLYGGYYLLKEVSKKIGLRDILKDALPGSWSKVLNLAFFLVATEDPSMYCKDWLSTVVGNGTASLASQRISELFSSITEDERNCFYTQWFSHMKEFDCVALDITSMSPYSKLMGLAESGCNQDHDELKQIPCLLLGEKSRLPVYQTPYIGSPNDASTLLAALDEVYALSPAMNIKIVTDKEFFSAQNIISLPQTDQMYKSESGFDQGRKCGFLTAVPITDGFAHVLVDRERAHIYEPENVIDLPEGVLYGVHRVCQWPRTGAQLNVFIYSNLKKISRDTDELNLLINDLKAKAEQNPFNEKFKSLFDKYLSIQKSKSQPSGYSVKICKDVIMEELYTNGWLILISNYITDPKEAISTYRNKDFVETEFNQLKKRLELPCMRAQTNERVQNKIFISFIALILSCHIDKVMRDTNLYKDYAMKELINKMSQIRRGSFNGREIIQPLDKHQKKIIKTFGIPAP